MNDLNRYGVDSMLKRIYQKIFGLKYSRILPPLFIYKSVDMRAKRAPERESQRQARLSHDYLGMW